MNHVVVVHIFHGDTLVRITCLVYFQARGVDIDIAVVTLAAMEHYCVFFYYFIVGERGGLPMDEIDTVVRVFRSDELHDVARGRMEVEKVISPFVYGISGRIASSGQKQSVLTDKKTYRYVGRIGVIDGVPFSAERNGLGLLVDPYSLQSFFGLLVFRFGSIPVWSPVVPCTATCPCCHGH